DEPTNHLDLDSREVLEDALNQFPGTILIVSHDRWFLNAVTNITLEMNSEGIERFQGSYDYWLAKKEARELEAIPPVPPVKPESKETVAAKLSPNEIYRRQQRLAQLEAEVAKAEDRQTQLSLELTDPQVGHEKLHQLSIELQQVQNLLAQHYREWESLADELEENQ
ncbi:MAG TPA: multidrug ABC transporter ATP-binding protein, partial [Firmicutes bacterium]|nr:multidrug ABC transporter ATP-binding protein [Bacillota bacterium]